jgi:hypothetical protein
VGQVILRDVNVLKKRMPIGVSDFKEIIEGNYYFIDKSLIVKNIVEDGSKVILLPRPRRFGKTLNMSMIKYFFDNTEYNFLNLFNGLEISNHDEIMKLQGQYPVIYLSFKDIKFSNWQECEIMLKKLLVSLFREYRFLLDADSIDEFEKEDLREFMLGKLPAIQYTMSLKILSEHLYNYYGKKVIILIDEYDVPIQAGYSNNYYEEIVNFMRALLSGAFKDNVYLEKGVLTGILRVARESIFSGLNNLSVCTLVSELYNSYFGFTKEEVNEVLKYYNAEEAAGDIRKWYNGYNFGGKTIYNPWSILNYIKYRELKAYWVNTSSNELVKTVLRKGNREIKEEMYKLIQGKSIKKIINENIVMNDIQKTSDNLWTFLLFTGYLKYKSKNIVRGDMICDLEICNDEIRYLFKNIIIDWFNESIENTKLKDMLTALTHGDIRVFSEIFDEFVVRNMSYFDPAGNEPEKVYHAFILGMCVNLEEEYEVVSNQEAGYGRADVMIIPRDRDKIGIIMEFKKIDKEDKKLENAVKNALKQIKDQRYEERIKECGVSKIIKLGIAFDGKKVLIGEE